VEERKWTFIGISHGEIRRKNCTTRALRGSKTLKKKGARVQCTRDAEVQEENFKFC
jgi:hypothetical protein